MNIIVHMTVRTRYSHSDFDKNSFCYYKQHKGDNFSIEETKNIIADNEMKVN